MAPRRCNIRARAQLCYAQRVKRIWYSPWWIALLTLGGLAALTTGLTIARPIVGRLTTRLYPGVTLVLAIDSAHPYRAGLAAKEAHDRTVERLQERLDPLTEDAVVRVDGDRVEVTLPADVQPERVARQLTRSGRLEFTLVDDGSDFMRQLARFAAEQGIEVGHDRWADKDSGQPHGDLYLRGPDRDALAAIVHRSPVAVPSDHAVIFERRDPADDGSGGAPARFWRSYYVFARPELDGDDITDAEALWDSQVDRPEVSLTFDDAGAKAFENVTTRAIGRKLAIVLEGTVNAAPVIEGKVSGGRALITIGGDNPRALTQETKDLVSVLRFGTMPAPVRLVEMRAPRR
jgi:preprotein translocase subunit SecD